MPTMLSIKTAVGFERKGTIVKQTIANQTGGSTLELTTRSIYDYINIPIMMKWSFGEKTKFFVGAGLYGGFLFSQQNVSKTSNGVEWGTSNSSASTKSFDFGATAGIGVRIPVKERFLINVEARANIGMIDVVDTGSIITENIRTNSVNLLVGFAYRLAPRDL